MIISKWMLLAGLPLILMACSESEPNQRGSEEALRFASLQESDALAGAAPQMDRARSQGGFDDGENQSSDETPSFLAYAYGMSVETPASNVEPLFQQHQQACIDAGSRVCQIINAQISNQVATNVSGRLEFRATPDWLASFRSGVAGDAEAAGGRLLADTTSAEDLSAPILDTRARLTAQISLRDRLQSLLETDGASVEELIQIERELARVQGDIESATSRLRYLEQRVSMSRLSLQYRSIAVPYTPSTTNPIISAINDFLGIVSEGLGNVIRVIAGILPWLILIIPGLWLVRFSWRRLRKKKAGQA